MGRNLVPGDVVLIHDKNPIKGKYQLGIVKTMRESGDKLVRFCTVAYSFPHAKDPIDRYTEKKEIIVTRSIQRLT